MRVKILGSAAGGGFPQWNCSCANCRRVREGSLAGVARTQTQLAWSVSPGQWTLVNASPDLRTQMEATPELRPQGGGRHSPICDVIVPGAEIDQALGLLLLREFHRFRVHATASVRKILTEDNSFFGALARFSGQVEWNDLAAGATFRVGGARVEAVPLAGSFPGFVHSSRAAQLNLPEAVLGLLVTPEAGGGSLAFFPGVADAPDALIERLQECVVVLFDGTFWSDEEPTRIPGVTRTARQMGHLPMSGRGGSLERLAVLQRPRKIFIHINNTNPVLDEESPEHQIVRESGWEIARDGLEIRL